MKNSQNIVNAIGSVPGLFILRVDGETAVLFFGSSTGGAFGHAWWQVYSGGSF